MAELERIYTIPLRQAFRNKSRMKKTNSAVKAVRAFLEKHMKSEEVRLGQHLNTFLWSRGIKSPPPRVTVKATKDSEGIVRAELEGKTFKESVKPIAKEEEPETLKEKLANKIGGKEESLEKKADETKPDEKTPETGVEKKPAAKAAEKPAPTTEKKTAQKPAEAVSK